MPAVSREESPECRLPGTQACALSAGPPGCSRPMLLSDSPGHVGVTVALLPGGGLSLKLVEYMGARARKWKCPGLGSSPGLISSQRAVREGARLQPAPRCPPPCLQGCRGLECLPGTVH